MCHSGTASGFTVNGCGLHPQPLKIVDHVRGLNYYPVSEDWIICKYPLWHTSVVLSYIIPHAVSQIQAGIEKQVQVISFLT